MKGLNESIEWATEARRGRKHKTEKEDGHSMIERISEKGSRMRVRRDGTREGERK